MYTPLRIFLVRHGETEWNRLGKFQGRADIPLNEKGFMEVEAMALSLRAEPLVAVYSSPLVRAVQTAQAILRHHPRAQLVIEEDLVEMDLGGFDGMEAAQWLALYPEFVERWRKSPAAVKMPGGESLEEVQKRALRALERMIMNHRPGESVAVCTHNFVALTILCHALGKPLNRFRDIRLGTGTFSLIYCMEGKIWAETRRGSAEFLL